MSKTHEEPPPDGTASDQGNDRPSIPSVESDALAARLKMLIRPGSVASFAKRCGLAESVLRAYISDGRMPSLDKALAIATAGGVTLDWLATGRGRRATAQVLAADTTASGSPGDAEGLQTPTLDTVVLEGILKAVLEAQGDRATPEHLAALTVDLYQRAMILDQPE
ncbi:helix-turn-helix domain-containing protein [Accumulibacter sp.]|uniref:helix-turn-helix domain-containing protein n=1 Tax=Accumulibacter sp. TaxID=2053492 RepID=UPI002619445C|nr:helix-turn-helix domain-containing protein [Accumulibacter sp.]